MGERVTEIVDCFATQTNVFCTILHTIIFKLYALAEIVRTFEFVWKRQTLFVVLHRRLFAELHVRIHKDMYMNANMWSILLGLPIESQRITSSWPDCEPVWCSLVLKFRPYYLMAMSKIRSNLTTSVYEKWAKHMLYAV